MVGRVVWRDKRHCRQAADSMVAIRSQGKSAERSGSAST